MKRPACERDYTNPNADCARDCGQELFDLRFKLLVQIVRKVGQAGERYREKQLGSYRITTVFGSERKFLADM